MIINNKLKLKKIIDSAKKAGKTVLIKRGVFDIIHPGHIFAISLFNKLADVVIILVQSDKVVNKRKGPSRPINNQKQRALVIDGLKGVDYTYLDKSDDRKKYIAFLKYLRPTILAMTAVDPQKTKDYSGYSWQVKEFPDKKKPGFSTTEIINKVLTKYKN